MLAVIGCALAILLRSVRAEYGFIIGGATALLLLLSVIGELTGLFDTIKKLCEAYQVPLTYFAALVKILGIAYLTQFGANLCRDAGQTAIAAKLELGGRIGMLACALPVAVTLLELAVTLLKGQTT